MEITPAISTPRQSAARDFYLAYLNSPAWRFRRNRALQDAGYRCSQCGGKRDLQAHHLTYERLGAELQSDLQVLCADCHENRHIEETAKSDSGIYLKLASEALRAEPFRSIADLAEDTKRLCAKHKIPYDGPEVNRALELITGTRIKRQERKPLKLVERQEWNNDYVTASEAHELLCRLGIAGMVHPMPQTQKTPAEQEAHEQALRDESLKLRAAQAARERRRKPLAERLAEIFG